MLLYTQICYAELYILRFEQNSQNCVRFFDILFQAGKLLIIEVSRQSKIFYKIQRAYSSPLLYSRFVNDMPGKSRHQRFKIT